MDRAEALRLAASNASISDKIRALDAAGYPRAEIARLLGKRYQHVRNVLEGDRLRPASAPATGVSDPGRTFRGPPPALAIERDVESRGEGRFRLVVREDGSVILPRDVLEAFGVRGRGVVMARLDGEEFRLHSAATAMRRVRELMAPYRWKEGEPLASDELIAERRAEAARDDG